MPNMDTATLRASALRWQQPWSPALPPVDGNVSAADRFTWMWQYGGIPQVVVPQVVTVVLEGETLSIAVVPADALSVPSFCVEGLAVPSHRAEVLSL